MILHRTCCLKCRDTKGKDHDAKCEFDQCTDKGALQNLCKFAEVKLVRSVGLMALQRQGKRLMPDGSGVPQPYFGCSKCKVNLCEACHLVYDHARNRVAPPSITLGV